MLKVMVFAGLCLLVVVGIVMTLLGNRRRHREAEQKTEEALRKAEEALQHNLIERRRRREEHVADAGAQDAAAATAGEDGAATAGGRPDAASFDPDATQMYMQPRKVAEAVVVPDRPQAAGAATGTAQLISLGGLDKGRHFPVPSRGLSIGRASDNDLVIVDSRVSSHHAWIGREAGKLLLRDYQSLNGTFINADMNTPVREVALVHGDTILFGGHGGSQYRLVVD